MGWNGGEEIYGPGLLAGLVEPKMSFFLLFLEIASVFANNSKGRVKIYWVPGPGPSTKG